MDHSEQGKNLHSINDKELLVLARITSFSNRTLHHGLIYTYFLTATENGKDDI